MVPEIASDAEWLTYPLPPGRAMSLLPRITCAVEYPDGVIGPACGPASTDVCDDFGVVADEPIGAIAQNGSNRFKLTASMFHLALLFSPFLLIVGGICLS